MQSTTPKKNLRSVLRTMKNKIIAIFLSVVATISLASCDPVFAQERKTVEYSPCINSNIEEDSDEFYLYVCKLQEIQYGIPYGLMQAIYSCPPSSIYEVGPVHIYPEDYAQITQQLKITDMERPQDNIELGAARMSDLLEGNGGDIYLALVNYYHATEEQDPFILDVIKKYYEIRSERYNRR